jgi:hypothetical protein
MSTNEPKPQSQPADTQREQEKRPRDDVYKRGTASYSRAADDLAALASDFADLAADWVGAFARGMRTFSETLNARRDSRDVPSSFARASSESASAVLDDLSRSARKAADKLVDKDKE